MSKIKALVLRHKIDEAKKKLAELRAKDAEFQTREDELIAAFNEVTDETSEDDKKVIDADIETFEKEKADHEESIKNIQTEIDSAESELAEVEEKQQPEEEPTVRKASVEAEKREVKIDMTMRFKNLSIEERTAFVERENVKKFLGDVRSIMAKSAVTGTELLIPTEVLPLIHSEIEQYSKLLKHVNVKKVAGKARQTVMGNVPEGIWTEMCASVKELSLKFESVEVDGYKVGGFVAVCNAVLEDSDISLASEVFEAIGQGIGYALDKAIVYGTGNKMPTGFAATAVTGKTTAADGILKSLIKAFGGVKHANGDLFWVVNNQTKMNLLAESLNLNSGVAQVSPNGGLNVLGGAVEVLDFVPNNEILGGYGENYLLTERAGITLKQSEEVQFIEDNTVFKGTARYDGKPVFNDAFIAFSTTATAPTAKLDSAHPFAGLSE